MNIDYNFFASMVNFIYPSELHLNKANVSYTEASFLDSFRLKFMINEMTDFYIVNFLFLDGDVPHFTSYDVYICQLICFALMSSPLKTLNIIIKLLQQNFLNKDINIINIVRRFQIFIGGIST